MKRQSTDPRLPQSWWNSLWWDFLAVVLFIVFIILGTENFIWLLLAVAPAVMLGARAWRRR